MNNDDIDDVMKAAFFLLGCWLVMSVDYTGLHTTDHYSNKADAADSLH